MNIIEKQNLNEILDQYIDEVVEEHSAMTEYCKSNCIACAKKQIASAIENYLALAKNLEDVALN